MILILLSPFLTNIRRYSRRICRTRLIQNINRDQNGPCRKCCRVIRLHPGFYCVTRHRTVRNYEIARKLQPCKSFRSNCLRLIASSVATSSTRVHRYILYHTGCAGRYDLSSWKRFLIHKFSIRDRVIFLGKFKCIALVLGPFKNIIHVRMIKLRPVTKKKVTHRYLPFSYFHFPPSTAYTYITCTLFQFVTCDSCKKLVP